MTKNSSFSLKIQYVAAYNNYVINELFKNILLSQYDTISECLK